MKIKNVTYVDIAKEAKVSLGTLSRYFNNGYVSDDKKARIQEVIEKFNYTPNHSAATVKKGNSFYIIIRTFASSKSQDLIVEGIISQLGKNTLVKYSPIDSDSIIEEVKWSLSLKPKGIICFASIDIDQNFIDQIAAIDPHIILYGHKNNKLTYAALDHEKAIESLSKEVKTIDFIYDNKSDVETYINKVSLFEKYHIKINAINHVNPQSNNYVFFQNRRLYLEENNLVHDNGKIIMTAQVYEKISNNNYAFIVDNFFVGVCLAKQVIGQIKSKDIEVIFHKKEK